MWIDDELSLLVQIPTKRTLFIVLVGAKSLTAMAMTIGL